MKDTLIIDYKTEYDTIDSQSLESLKEKYRNLLLYSSKNESRFLDLEKNLNDNNLINPEDGIFLKNVELKKIKDSLVKKNENTKKIIIELRNKQSQNIILEKQIISLNEKIFQLERLNTSYVQNQDKFFKYMGEKLIINSQENTIEEIVFDSKPSDNLKKSLLKLNNDLKNSKEEYDDLFLKYNKLNERFKLYAVIDPENIESMKQLLAILKASNLDSNLLKELHKKIKENEDLLKKLAQLNSYEINLDYEANNLEKDNKEILDFFRMFLPIVELFRHSIPKEDISLSKELSNWKRGFEMVYTKMEEAIIEFSIEIINPKYGDTFNSEIHESISIGYDKNLFNNQIIETTERGFRYKDKLLKPAKVKVQR